MKNTQTNDVSSFEDDEPTQPSSPSSADELEWARVIRERSAVTKNIRPLRRTGDAS
jgi:hypothetical protein